MTIKMTIKMTRRKSIPVIEQTPVRQGRFIEERYVPGEGIYAVFEDGAFLIQKSPYYVHAQKQEQKNRQACSRLIDKIFREKTKKAFLTKENITQHVG